MTALLDRSRSMRAAARYVIAFAIAAAAAFGLVKLDEVTADPPDFDQACLDGSPYFVASSLRAQSGRSRPPDSKAPSVILFQDTPADDPQFELASFGDTGAVFGIAYNRTEPAIYAGAFRKRGLPLGNGGSGGIYRIDLTTGAKELWLTIPDAGSQRGSQLPDGSLDHDENAARDVGKEALGDVEITDDGAYLFTVNLKNRMIYRVDMETKAILDAFEMGAMSESWGPTAGRPFGLAWHRGRLYHGAVNSRGAAGDFVAKIYSSLPDGSDMQEVAEIDLRYRRDGVRLRHVSGSQTGWRAWSDEVGRDLDVRGRPRMHRPQPMLTDLTISADGAMVVGLRDRHWDISLQWIRAAGTAESTAHAGFPTATAPVPPGDQILSEEGLGFGDILLGEQTEDGWSFDPQTEHFDDTNAVRHDESALGGVAWIPYSDQVAATSFGVERASRDTLAYEGTYWYEIGTGNKLTHETVGAPGQTAPYETRRLGADTVYAHGPWIETLYEWSYTADIGSLGDVEVLCIYEPPPPTPTEPPPTPLVSDTPTDVPPTATPTPIPTDPPTPTATPVPLIPAYLPLTLRENCTPDRANADTVLVIDNSSSMTGAKIAAAREAALAFMRAVDLGDDQLGIVVFSEEARVVMPLSTDEAALGTAIRGIEPAYGTRIDLGLAAGRDVLDDPARKDTNTPMIILLTDGIQIGDPERPQELARGLRDDGVELYVVGLGKDVEAEYLERLAGDRDHLRLSPGPDELAAIYEEIARLIPCKPEAFWGRR